MFYASAINFFFVCKYKIFFYMTRFYMFQHWYTRIPSPVKKKVLMPPVGH